MTRSAKSYIAVFVGAGALTLAAFLSGWRAEHQIQFAAYLLFAVVGANLKVSLPGVTGTMSVCYTFILISVISLNFPQTLLIGCASTMAQCFLHSKHRPKLLQILFNVAGSVVSSACCYWVYHAPWIRALDASMPALLFCASLAYFLCNTFSVTGIIALTEGKSVWRVWHESFLWTAPQYLVGAAVSWLVGIGNLKIGWQPSILILPSVYLVYRSYNIYLGRIEQERAHVSQMSNLHLRAIEALALAIDAKDETTHDHLKRVQVYAVEIANELGLSESEMHALRAAALLHDIGKLAVPEHIISKPGKLTPEEFEKMKIHPIIGAEILERVEFPYPVAPIVRSHHEKWDGSGYPDGLRGEQIPIGARILAVVDCFDALASDRQYRRALPLDKALAHVVSEAGRSFEPRIVDILQRRHRQLEQMAKATSTGGAKLSMNVRVQRGAAPSAGFEKTARGGASSDGVDFVASIAGARQEFHMLLELTGELGSSLSVDETFSLLGARLKSMIPHDAMAIYMCKDGQLLPQFVNGQDNRLFSSLAIPVGLGLSGWVVDKKRPIVNGDPSVECCHLDDAAKFSTLRSALSIPLEGASGVIGALTLYHMDSDAFSRDHLRMLLAIGPKAGLTIENAMRYRQVEKSSATDELTGLPNARSLFEHLNREITRCVRTGESLSVMVLDLDGFKQVNDRFGHLAGNRVLQQIAHGLKATCREQDYVARMGGDEFVVILPNAHAETRERKSIAFGAQVMEAGRRVCGEEVVSLSLGHASFPSDGMDAEHVLAAADKRMYQMKREHHTGPASKVLQIEDLPVGVLVH